MKKLGLLVLDARLNAHKDLKEVAEAVGISPRSLHGIEMGVKSPSLPELEALAFCLNVPLEHFWGNKIRSEQTDENQLPQAEHYVEVRQRIIATALRMSRLKLDLSYRAISEKTGISESKLKRYEGGDVPIPVVDLDLLVSALDITMTALMVEHGKIGDWRLQQDLIAKFVDLPVEMQKFFVKPVNRPYLELAMRLSNLSADRLRTIAEGILEITY